MSKFIFYRLINSKWVEQEEVDAKGRKNARKKLEGSNQIKGEKDCSGTWKIRKIEN
jgi:hypothetical protein